ncbi:MAG: metal ABC transporter ATP-binding protein [Anaerolineales bacterium]|nr:metal ABC transporter ATP-binding protein [Anaerolineales bacterium]
MINLFRSNTFFPHHVQHRPDAPLLEVSDLSVRYDSTLVLDNISFQLETGQRAAVIGPNGAGKTTLFKVIAGVLPYTSGRVNIYGHKPGGHICIAYLPQRSQVDWRFPVNVSDVVMMGRIGKLGVGRVPGKKDWLYVRQCLKEVGMAELAGRQISELSGGQQQRMFIARALAQEAELFLMDEPFTGLDVTSQEDILHIMDGLRQRGVTVFASTHDLHLASEKFERVMLLNRYMIGYGKPGQVFNRENLIEAFGGHIRLIPSGAETLAVGDSCCEDENI